MKISATTVLAAAAVAIGAATAFTVGGPQSSRGLSSAANSQQSTTVNNRLGATFLRMDTDAFAKSEIDSNDVSTVGRTSESRQTDRCDSFASRPVPQNCMPNGSKLFVPRLRDGMLWITDNELFAKN